MELSAFLAFQGFVIDKYLHLSFAVPISKYSLTS